MRGASLLNRLNTTKAYRHLTRNAVNTRVAIVYDWHLDARSGGPTGYLFNLRAGLEARGNHSVEFIVRPDGVPTRKMSLGTSDTCDSLVDVYDSHDEYARAQGHDFGGSMLRSVERYEDAGFHPEIIRRIDASQATLFHVHTTRDCVKLHNHLTSTGRRHQVKLVLTSHTPEIPAREWADVVYAQGRDAQLAQAVYQSYRLNDKLAFCHADALIFPCEQALDPYHATWPDLRAFIRHKPVYWLPSGARELARPTVTDPRETFGTADRFTMAYLGRHNSVKGYDLLVRARKSVTERIPDATFLIGGKPGPVPAPVAENWIEIGWTDTPQDVLQACDVFVLPNRLTYFDLIVLEVLSAGRMILASNTGGNKYFADKSPGIVLFEDEDDLVEKLCDIAAMPKAERESCAAENRKLYQKEFTVEAFADRYSSVVDQIATDLAPRPIGVLSGKTSQSVAVSVVVPVYNVDAYVADCLDSILDQDFTNFEVIVVNDGSTDDSLQVVEDTIARRNASGRVRLVTQENRGLSEARNTGLDYCRGDYVCFIDSDDLLHPRYLSELHRRCEADGTKMALCAITIFGQSYSQQHSTSHDDKLLAMNVTGARLRLTADVITNLFPSAWNKLYHRSLLDDVRWPRGLLFEDNPVHIELLQNLSEVSYVGDALYFHRDDREDRITRKASDRYLEIATVFSLCYSSLVARLGAKGAEGVALRLLSRLFWERLWHTKGEDLCHALNALFCAYSRLIHANEDAFAFWKDSAIEPSFYTDSLQALENRRKTGSVAAAPVADILKIRDKSLCIEGAAKHTDGSVMHKEDGSVLIHPKLGDITIAEVSGLGRYGRQNYEFLFSLEHAQAAETEIRVCATPEALLTPESLRSLLESKTDVASSTDWITLGAQDSIVLSVFCDDFGPCTTFYIASRAAGDCVDFSWLHLRKIVASPAPSAIPQSF